MPPFKAKPGASASDSASAPQSNPGPSSSGTSGDDTSGLPVLLAPAGTTSITIDGQAYEVVNGRVSVLARHVEPLRAIGFSFVAE